MAIKLLKNYVLKQFLKTYALTLSGLIGIFMIVDAFERMDEFISRDRPLAEFMMYYIYKVPFIISYMAPQAVLLATVITLAGLARNNEFIAMKACGIGVTGITLPILSSSLVLAFLIILNNEFVAPVSSERMNYIFNVKVRGNPEKGKIQQDNLWLRSPNGSIWNINFYDPDQAVMKNVSLYHYDENALIIRQRIDADTVKWDGKRWIFMDGYLRIFRPNGLDSTEYFEEMAFPVLEVPADFKKVQKRPEEMSAREMYATILSQQSEGLDTSILWVDLNQKLSYPFISVVLALIGIPLSIRSSRSGGVLFCVAVSMGIGFTFSFIYAMGISLGHSGTFDPFMAAWGPCLLFICIGFYLLLTLDSEKLLPI